MAARSWTKYLKTMGLFLSVGAIILTEPREAGADDTFKDPEAIRKAEEDAKKLQEFLQNTQGIGESDREYEARRQCLMGAAAACH